MIFNTTFKNNHIFIKNLDCYSQINFINKYLDSNNTLFKFTYEGEEINYLSIIKDNLIFKNYLIFFELEFLNMSHCFYIDNENNYKNDQTIEDHMGKICKIVYFKIHNI